VSDGGVPHDEVSDGVLESILEKVGPAEGGWAAEERGADLSGVGGASTSPRQLVETVRVGMVSPEAFQDGLAALDALLAELEQVKKERDEALHAEDVAEHYREDAVAERDRLESDLRHFGNHVPPCPRWITSGSPEMNPCLCGFDAALASMEGDK